MDMNKFSNDNFLTSYKRALLISKIENHNEHRSLSNFSPQKSN